MQIFSICTIIWLKTSSQLVLNPAIEYLFTKYSFCSKDLLLLLVIFNTRLHYWLKCHFWQNYQRLNIKDNRCALVNIPTRLYRLPFTTPPHIVIYIFFK